MPTDAPYRRILCAIDFSAPSRQALSTAAELAARFDSELTVLHVYQVPVLGYPESGPGSPFRTSLAEFASQELTEWQLEAERLSGRKVNAVVLEGVPWDQITKYTREHPFDLAVVGTQGRTGLKHVVLGSVAERVVRHAACPVLVAREVQP